MTLIVAIIALVVLSACTPIRLVRVYRCADGLPVLILQHPSCRDGICGYSCEPDRWKEALTPSDEPT